MFIAKNAQLRMQHGKDYWEPKDGELTVKKIIYGYEGILRGGTWTLERVICFPGKKPKEPRIFRVPMTSEIVRKMIKAEKREYHPFKDELEQALQDSTVFPTEKIEIPTNRFDSEELTVWAFGGESEARAYGEFIRGIGVKRMPVESINMWEVNTYHGRPFFTPPIWFGGLDASSEFSRYFRDMRCCNDRLRGIKYLDKPKGKQ